MADRPRQWCLGRFFFGGCSVALASARGRGPGHTRILQSAAETLTPELCYRLA
jgi:hypothetical protein